MAEVHRRITAQHDYDVTSLRSQISLPLRGNHHLTRGARRRAEPARTNSQVDGRVRAVLCNAGNSNAVFARDVCSLTSNARLFITRYDNVELKIFRWMIGAIRTGKRNDKSQILSPAISISISISMTI